ncbi:MAG: pyridoxamine 5'-phosphate oxidase family protein [Candidatus Thiodiazotropha sp.]
MQGDIVQHWPVIKRLFRDALATSTHYAIASVSPNGEPHVTPIGSLILDRPGYGYYFEAFARQLPKNLEHNRQVCVLAVNSSRWYWLKSLLGGRFASPPALRLLGTAGELRPATDAEIARWQRRVRSARHTRGHKLIWRDMNMVREIEFQRIEPVRIGPMTAGLIT